MHNVVKHFPADIADQQHIAIGVSGGPDSMALCKLLSMWSQDASGPHIHALIVDHGLREGSAAEAQRTARRLQDWPNVIATILTCDGLPSDTRIQEQARTARYALMRGHCAAHDIRYLALAHHRDDQAETVLFRLAKGSGLDGLAGMQAVQPYDDGLTLLRPLLDVPKADLIEFCTAKAIEYEHDPSNEREQFARVRLRNSADILAEEGLTSKRLAATARRVARAKAALEALTEEAFEQISLEINTQHVVLNNESWRAALDEIAFRLILKAVKTLRSDQDYLPRMDKLEDLFADLRADEPFRRRTLGGLVFARDDKLNHIVIERENQ